MWDPTHTKCLVNVNSHLLFLPYLGSHRLFGNKPHTQHQKQGPSSNFDSAVLWELGKMTSLSVLLFPYLHNEGPRTYLSLQLCDSE